MNWIKRHKLWSLLFAYLGVGILVSLVGVIPPFLLGELMGLLLLPYLFFCWGILRMLRKDTIEEVK